MKLNDPRILSLALLAGLAFPAGTTSVRAQQGGDGMPEAREIVDAIEEELRHDPAVSVNGIDIEMRKGTVILRGTQSNLLAKRQATRLARTVKGVRSVVNDIAVIPNEQRSDPALERAVERALLTDAAADSYEIDVTVNGGVATLTGEVDSWRERKHAERVAAGVIGIRGVENTIAVVFDDPRLDSEIRQDIRAALRWDTLVDHELVDVAVDDGDVVLTGVVGSAAEKERARSDAMVAGAAAIDVSGLDVERWARDSDLRKTKYKAYEPEQVEDAIERAMLYSPEVDSTDVTTQYRSDGLVTLRGVVGTLSERRAATRLAENTVGVRAVDNRVKVRADIETGLELEEDVEWEIASDPYLESFEIDVDVLGQTAYLDGTVDNFFEKSRAQQAAEDVLGVERVVNRLEVLRPAPLFVDPYAGGNYVYDEDWYIFTPARTFRSDSEIREDIASEMWWSPFVDSDEVNVTVDDGEATLTGVVDSWSEVRAATENAYEGGATWVRNLLRVENDGEGS